jgi:hypothetical protein
MTNAGGILTALGLSALVGGMLFFGAILTPLVFTKLPPEYSGPFIRAVFPRYYAFIIVSAGLGALGYLLRAQMVSAVVMLVIVVVTLFLLFWLIPQLNAWRDAGNQLWFDRGHRFSVWVNGAEIIAALWLLVRAAV